MASDSIRYRFAHIDGSEDVVNIDSFMNGEHVGHSFCCPCCKEKLIPVLGDIRQHHFRHVGEKCNPDRYLHTVAERVFVEEFNKCVKTNSPFLIEYERPTCCTRECSNKNSCTRCDKVSIDLAKEYETVSSECRVDFDDHYRRPDILLDANDGRQLWIEIWVTHETVTEKMKDAPIIEVKIKSEEDISMIRNHHLKAIKTSNLDIAFLSEPEILTRFNTERCFDFMPKRKTVQPSLDEELSHLPVLSRPSTRSWKADTPAIRNTKPLGETPVFDETQVDWVDLGLPSSTLWAKEIEPCKVTFSDAVKTYGTYLPSKVKAEELRDRCNQEWDYETRSIILTGPNGNSISVECTKKDSITLWLNQYDNDGVRPFSRDYNQYGRCMNVTASQFFINNADAYNLASVLLTKKP